MPIHVQIPGREVAIETADVLLPGSLALPAQCRGLILFAHGSGSSRFSPRNVRVAETLGDAGLATLLFDLLSDEEADDQTNVFDVPLLASRLAMAAAWAGGEPELAELPLGYFGASTGAAAALLAAAQRGHADAIVSRGGRPDLVGTHLREVRTPTLLIVGGRDKVVLELNRQALALLECEAELRIVEGATHLFQEPGALDEVARVACDWFLDHVTQAVGDPGHSRRPHAR